MALAACSSDRHFAADTLWPFGNPNGPIAASETAQRSLGHQADIAPITPQAGNVWPGPVQPVPTIADQQKAMDQPLGSAYSPSLPSPYPPGTEPPPNADLGTGPLGGAPLGDPGTQTFSMPDSMSPNGSDMAPLTGPLGGNGVQPGTVSGPSSVGGTSGGAPSGSSSQ